MPKTNTVNVSLNSNGQYQVTMPRHIVGSYELPGETIGWKIETGTKLSVHPIGIDEDTELPTTKVSKNNRGQIQTTIPSGLGSALELSGEKVTWGPDGKALTMEKVDE